jgi:hypothetical protein
MVHAGLIPSGLIWILFLFLTLCCMSGPTVLIVGMWRAQVSVSSKNMAYRLFRTRLVPWKDILSVRWKKGEDFIVTLKNGRYIAPRHIANQKGLADSLKYMVAKYGLSEPCTQMVEASRETFHASRSKYRTSVFVLTLYLTFLLAFGVYIFLKEDITRETDVKLLSVICVCGVLGGAIYWQRRRYQRAAVEISEEGIRFLDKAVGRLRHPPGSWSKTFIKWDEIVIARWRGHPHVVLVNGATLSLWEYESASILLNLIENKVDMLQKQGQKVELRPLKKSAVAAFVLGTLVFYGIIAVIVFHVVKRM